MAGPANDDEDYEIVELDIGFDALIEAMRAGGAEVDLGLLTDGGEFLIQAND